MGKQLQMTLDDGPDPVASALTPILDELARRRVVAAFFNLGQEVHANRVATREIVAKGHVLGNHSWDHLNPHTSNYTDAQVVDQFRRCHDEVLAATQVAMRHWRAPRLEDLGRLNGLLSGPGKLYALSHCDIGADSRDSQGATTASAMLAAIRAAIAARPDRTTFRLLFHIVPATATALPTVLDGLLGDGHTLVNFAQAT